MFASTLWMTMVLAVAADSPSQAPSAVDAVVHDCRISALERQEVPGTDAGVLVEMIAIEGMKVTKGMDLGRVDDREAKANLLVKHLEYDVAQQEADSDVGIQYQQATADVAEKAWEKLKAANKGASKAISEIEVLRAELEFRKAELGIQKEREQNAANKLTAKAKKAEWAAAQVVVDRRILKAPFDGVVVKVSKHPGEWAAAGEPVVEIVRIDRLSIRGDLFASEWSPLDIEGRNVTVEVALPRGRVEKMKGRVVFVSPVVEGGKRTVWAEVETPMDKSGRPLVSPGLTATMTIHVSQPVAETRPVATSRSSTSPKATTKN